MTTRFRIAWALWLQWIVAHAAAGAATAAVYATTGQFNTKGLPIPAVGVAVLGIAQWLVVRRWIPGVRSWPWATLGGAVAGLVISLPITGVWFVFLFLIGATSAGPSLLGLFGGMAALVIGVVMGVGIGVGFGQWMLLRHQTPWAALWIPASIVANIFAGVAVALRYTMGGVLPWDFALSPNGTAGAAAVGALGGAVSGALTGFLLAVLVKERRPQPAAVQIPPIFQTGVGPDTTAGHPIATTPAVPAKMGPRFGAMVMDSLLVLAVSVALLMVGSWVTMGAVFLVPFIYHWVLTSLRGQTLGKMLAGVKVVDAEGRPPDWKRAALREFLSKSLFSTPLWYFAFGPLMMGLLAGLGSIGLDKHRQGWHDKLAGTYVVRAQD